MWRSHAPEMSPPRYWVSSLLRLPGPASSSAWFAMSLDWQTRRRGLSAESGTRRRRLRPADRSDRVLEPPGERLYGAPNRSARRYRREGELLGLARSGEAP